MISKRIIVVCILLLNALPGYSKQGKVYGKVTDDQGKPLELCVIKAVNSSYSAYSNAHGEFSLEYNADSSKSLVVSCLGYETEEVSIGNDALWVVLKHKVNKLNDIVVVDAADDKGKIKLGILGKKDLKPYGICSDIRGSENAIFLRADAARHGLLKEVFFYITKEGIPNAKFRMHVYDIDTASLPGNDLLDSNIVLHATEGAEWVKVDVSSRRIPVGRGVFISMEWLSGSGNNPNVITDNEHHEQWKYNTVVLAMTKGYNKQHSLNYERSKMYNKWNYSGLDPDRHEKYLNPMIYATYTYRKK